MPDTDFSSPEHRLDNMSNMKFVRAYADIRHEVWANMDEPRLGYYLRGYMRSLEEELAAALGLEQTTLVGRLVDIGNRHMNSKDAKDGAESGEG